MTDDTLLHNGTVQRADFRLIHPTQWQRYHITTKRTHQPLSKEGLPHKEHNNPVLTERTQESHKQPGHKQKKNENSEDKILSIINGFKNYKITHLTRPNELGTTTSEVGKRNPDTTRL